VEPLDGPHELGVQVLLGAEVLQVLVAREDLVSPLPGRTTLTCFAVNSRRIKFGTALLTSEGSKLSMVLTTSGRTLRASSCV
jgi:hypothetical protein